MSKFDNKFDRELNKTMIDVTQKLRGCFECGKGRVMEDERGDVSKAPWPSDFPTQLCSRCRVAHYCGVECQKVHWKSEHKHLCNTFCENSEDNAFSTLENLCASGWLPKPALVPMMRNRQELFFRAIQKYGISLGRPVKLEAVVAAIEQMEEIHLVMSVSFWPSTSPRTSKLKQRTVPRVILECIDEGPVARQNIYIERGVLSSAALEQAIQHLLSFVEKCSRPDSHCQLSGIELGRGLAPKLEEIEAKLEGVPVDYLMGYAD